MSISLEKELAKQIKDLAKIKGNAHQVKMARAGIAWSQAYRRLFGEVQPSSAKHSAPETAKAVNDTIPFEIEIPEVTEEIYAETRRAVAATGVFITFIKPVTMQDLLAEEAKHYKKGEPYRLGYVNNSRTVLATVPPAMEVFIDPSAVRLEDSNWLSTDAQIGKIKEAEARFKNQLPEPVRPFVSLIMADPSTYSQLEDIWIDKRQELLFSSFFARTDVRTMVGAVAVVGRYSSSAEERIVAGWARSFGYCDLFAAPVGVLPKIESIGKSPL